MAQESSVKSRIEKAMNEPKVRPGFVDELVVRTGAVEAGRKAEETLAGKHDLTPDEKHRLAAESVVGRLMQDRKPPKNVTAGMMVDQLVGNKRFTDAADRAGDRLAMDLRSGELIRRVGMKSAAEKTAKSAAAEKIAEKAGEAKAPEAPALRVPGAK